MTPDQFRECLALLHWSQRGLAGIVGRDERQVRRWASGDAPIPPDVAAWLQHVAAFMSHNPPPVRVRRRPK